MTVYQMTEGNMTSVDLKPGRAGVESRGQIYMALSGQNASAHHNALKRKCDEVSSKTSTESISNQGSQSMPLGTPVKCNVSFSP